MRSGLRCTVVLSCLSCLASAGCEAIRDRDMRIQAERVAKDWSRTIRASQVIPVYPLTEDLQPGDVFVVQTPIQTQHEEYNRKGFLPLDQLVCRLEQLSYSRFYRDAYWKGTYATVPHDRPAFAGATAPTTAPAGDEPPFKPSRFTGAALPRAAFPSYEFEVANSGGARMALPISGVPVGLSLMGAARGKGTVTISDSFTYAIDGQSLLEQLYTWGAQPAVQAELSRTRAYATGKNPMYLRVINRVYLTGGVVVSIQNSDVKGGGADAGTAKSIELLDMSEDKPNQVAATTQAYKTVLDSVSETINEGLPGGSVRVAALSRRSVVLKELFDRPLVIGYLGFDVEVYADGTLGPAVTTIERLRKNLPEVTRAKRIPGSTLLAYDFAGMSSDYAKLKALPATDEQAKRALETLNGLSGLAPTKWPVNVYGQTDNGPHLNIQTAKGTDIPAENDFRRVTTYMGELNSSAGKLTAALASPDATLDGNKLTKEQRVAMEGERLNTIEEVTRVSRQLNSLPTAREALKVARQK